MATGPDCNRASILPPDHRHELRDGHWERRGLIRIWISHICPDCGHTVLPGDRCDTCLTWAIKNARDHDWAQQSRALRPYITALIQTRHQRARAA